MGGPTASVLLRDPLTKQQVNELDLWLQSITNPLVRKTVPRAHNIWTRAQHRARLLLIKNVGTKVPKSY
jgi:hypothetical protein